MNYSSGDSFVPSSHASESSDYESAADDKSAAEDENESRIKSEYYPSVARKSECDPSVEQKADKHGQDDEFNFPSDDEVLKDNSENIGIYLS